MGRHIIKHKIISEESCSNILPENKELMDDFLRYLKSIDRSPTTIEAYTSDLNIFFVYNLENNNNKRFPDITKREFIRFQDHALNEWQWSPRRLRRVKSAISSLSNYIENVLDEDPKYANYKSSIRKIESPVNQPVLDKTIFTNEELQKLLDYLVSKKRYRQAAVLSLCMNSGRRRSEIPRFKTEYFTDDNVIFGSLWKTPEKVKTKGRGSKGKQIHLYVLKKQFEPYLKLWMDYRKENGIESEWLFPNMNDYSKPMSTETMRMWVKPFSRFLGKDFYWHSLRHYFTTELVRNDIPANVIKEMINWETTDMVDLYTDLSSDDLFGKYFDENGIKKIQYRSVANL